MNKFTIYGERCSGTTYLENLLILNFDIQITWDYGWKHFFVFSNLQNSDNVLFIGIIRNLEDWINSLYIHKHHLALHLTNNIDAYLKDTFWSITKQNNEMMNDRHIETGERYKNIFELRLIKNKFLIEKMPTLVKNYCLITHDDLLTDFDLVMNKLKNCGLKIKNNIKFPLNTIYYKGEPNNNIYKKKENIISKEKIKECCKIEKELMIYENILFPNFTL